MRRSTLSWVASAVRRSATVVVSTHETAPFDGIATRTLRLEAGRLVS
jgi:ABC-type ATPase involved in cell division